MAYDTHTVASNARKVFTVGTGETMAGYLLDVSASGAAAAIAAHATNWTIRDVGIAGEMSGSRRTITCSDVGENTSTISNVYLGDGTDGSGESPNDPPLGILVDKEHNGHLDIEYVYIEGANDNAIYASGPGSSSNAGHGTVDISDCYTKDCWVSHYRLANGTVDNCVAVNTDSGRSGRALWVWPTDYHDGDVSVTDCDFLAGEHAYGLDFGQPGRTTEVSLTDTAYAPEGATREQGDVQLEETNVSHDPTDHVPDGVPQSADDAASGGGSDAPEPEPPEDPVENEDYQNVVVQSGDHAIIEVGAGQVLENVTFDVTADDTAVTIRCRGDGWVVRNVAFAGPMDLDSAPCYAITASCDGGEGLIEDVYMGDGAEGTCGGIGTDFQGRGAIYTTAGHEGNITIRNATIERWGREGVRNEGSGPQGGSVEIENVYFARLSGAHVTLGTRGSTVSDCVFYHPIGEANGIAAYYHQPEHHVIEDCDFQWDGEGFVAQSFEDGGAVFRNCRFSGDEP